VIVFVNSQISPFFIPGICVVLMKAVIPANIPILIANATPIFSLVFMLRVKMTVHGSRARIMSMAPEYATHTCQPN
jgi:hypothetical protein